MTSSFAHDDRELAATYDRISDSQLESGKRLVERLGIGPGARVLDVGCGTGRLAEWLAERVGADGRVAGIDPLDERIRIARTRITTARFEVGQAEQLGAFDDASFDAVCMSAVLHWVGDKTKALAEARRVLRPGGKLGVTTLPHELAGAGTVARVLLPLLTRAPYAGRVDLSALTFAQHGRTATDHIALVQQSGMELLELHVVQRVRRHGSGAALVDFLDASSFGNFLHIVPDELREQFRAELIAALEQHEPTPDGGVTVCDWGMSFIAARG